MSLLATLFSLFFLSAGVSLVCTLAVIGVNDALRRTHAGFHELETIFAHIFGVSTHPTERVTRGLLALFLTSWAATLAFFIARIANLLPLGVLGVALYALVLIMLAGIVVFPLLGYGLFGRQHHPRAPLWIMLLSLVFALVLGVCTSILF